MTQNFEQAKNLIQRSHNILLTMHERMDGDDGGSVGIAFAT
jgi:nanoRNase/pAp phosphatase (c-di-AMP/oligoRNAs hydrolase)